MKYPKIILKNGKDAAVKRLHQWIFSGAIKSIDAHLPEGAIVEVYSSQNEFLGMGHYQIGSIAVRIFSFDKLIPDHAFWTKKLTRAYQLRQTLGLIDNSQTNVYRLVHAEGDGLPGLVIDFYNGTAVIQTHSIGMHLEKDNLVASLKEIYGPKLKAIYDKSAETLPKKANLETENGYLFGKPDTKEVLEYGNKFSVDWETGQKTGFFIDQRENRKLLAAYSENKRVLNTFCYSGGFSVFAMNAGAKEVHSVDSSAKAIALTENNIALNQRQGTIHQSFEKDVIKHIREIDDQYDVIILDPPAFAKHQNVKHNAVQGYKRLNAEAISRIKPGGILFTFSCSQVVDKALFNHTLTAAAIEVGRKVKILHYLSQPGDHPINIFHPESEYLKGLVLYVE
jgi:23S rRNA (cytosine1962-C5)-methyltransferase